MAALTLDTGEGSLLLLLAATAAVLCCAWATMGALVRGRQPSPGWRAVALWMPMALVTLLATLLNHPQVAVSLIFATSVGSLCLGLGVVAAVSGPIVAPPEARRIWLFVLPVALLTLIVGFSGHFAWQHGLALAVEGLVIFNLWQERSPSPVSAMENPGPSGQLRVVELVLALALGALGAWAAVRGIVQINQHIPVFSVSLGAVALLGPLLVLPVLLTGVVLASRGQAWAAASTSVGVVLLNLCVALPLTIALWYGLPAMVRALPQVGMLPMVSQSATQPATQRAADADPPPVAPLPYPLAAWRVDTVLLVVLGLFLLPLSLGRWTPGRQEGVALLIAYAFYLLLAVAAGLQGLIR